MTENIELDSPEVRHSAQALTETDTIVPEIDDRRLPARPRRSVRAGGTPFIRMRILRAASEHNNIHPYIRPEAVPAFDPSLFLCLSVGAKCCLQRI